MSKILGEDIEAGDSKFESLLTFPKEIIGREEEKKTIASYYDKLLCGGRASIQVEGQAGVGKTTLIKATLPDEKQAAYYLGKFNQFDKGTPYQGFRGVFKSYIQKLSVRPQNEIKDKKKEILSNFSGQLPELKEILPEIFSFLEIDIEEIKLADETSLFNNVNRIDALLIACVEFISENQRVPVILHLDDIQWMDSSSFRVINSLLKMKTKGLMFIFTYRPEEITKNIGYTEFKELTSADSDNCLIQLKGFGVSVLEKILSSILGKCNFEVLNLANVIYDLSEGNPFVLREVLLSLERSGQLSFRTDQKEWIWKYNAQNIFKENKPVHELLDENLNNLSAEDINCLQIGSCFGSKMNIPFISLITKIELVKLNSVFELARKFGFVERVEVELGTSIFVFSHSLVGETIHNSFKEIDKKDIHSRIGNYYLNHSPLGMDSRDLYKALYHVNESVSDRCSAEERLQHSKLNLKGAQKAKRSASFSVANKYIQEAKKFNHHTLWKDQYNFSVDFHIEAFQITRLTGDKKLAQEYYQTCEVNSTGIKLSELRLAKLIIDIQFGEMESALETGIKALRELGLNVPFKAGKIKVLIEFLKTKIKLKGLSPEDILSLPKLENKEVSMMFQILIYTYKAAYVISPELNGVLALKQMQLTLANGINGEAYTGFVAYGVIIGAGTNNYQSAFEIANVAGRMADQFGYTSGILDFGKSIYMCLKYPIRETLHYASSAKSMSYVAGDFLSAAEPSANESLIYLSAGFPLDEVAEIVENNKLFCEELSMKDYFDFQKIMEQHVKKLRGIEVEESLSNDVRRILSTTQFSFSISINKILELQRSVFEKNWKEALRIANTDKEVIQHCAGMHIYTEYFFFKAIAVLKNCKSYNSLVSLKDRLFVNSVISKMTKWSKSAPENHNHRCLILKGLVAQSKGKYELSIELLRNAASEAESLGFVQNAMIANQFIAEIKGGISNEDKIKYLAKSDSLRTNWLVRV